MSSPLLYIKQKVMALDWMDEILEGVDASPEKSIINTKNKNNHAGVERREASERAEAILKLINEYRLYANRFQSLPTWDVLEFLRKMEKELFKRFGEEVENGELDRVRNEYFLLFGKKPFMAWGIDELKRRMDEFKPAEISEKTLHSKKSRWEK